MSQHYRNRPLLPFSGRMRTALIVLLALSSSAAHAFFDPPQVVPSAPRADELVSVQIRGGICDTFTDDVDDTVVTRNGSSLRMVIDGIQGPDGFCIYPIFTIRYPVGVFAPGDYVLTVVHRYQDITGQFIEQPIGTVAFSVGAASTPAGAVSIPAMDWLGVGVLGLLVGLLGLWRVFRHAESAG